MSDNGFRKHWTDVGELVAMGYDLGNSELYAIYDNVDIFKIDPGFLPDRSLAFGTPLKRKNSSFFLAEQFWGLTPRDWLEMEKTWLQEARSIRGITETSGKDKISDVVSSEILLSLIAAAKLVTENRDGGSIAHEAHIAINLILGEVCAKGRTRMMVGGKSTVYGSLRDGGLMFGLGGGKYLPYPEKSLPALLLMLDKSKINPHIYLP